MQLVGEKLHEITNSLQPKTYQRTFIKSVLLIMILSFT